MHFQVFFAAMYQWFLSQLPPDAYIVRRLCGHREVSRFVDGESFYQDMAALCRECQEIR